MKTGIQSGGIGRVAKAMALAAVAATMLAACGDDTTEFVESPMLVLDDPLSFEGIAGESTDASFDVMNEGEDDVEYAVLETPGWLDVDSAARTVEAGATDSVEVGVTCPDEPSELEGTVVLEAGDFGFSVDATLNCEALEPGSLNVEVSGLPDEMDARIDVVGPQGFEAEVEATQELEDLVPGEYRIYAFDVGEEQVYSPEPEDALVEVEAGQESTVSFDYELVLGGLEIQVSGLPDDAEPMIEVIDLDGESQSVVDGDVLEDLEPGTYEVIPSAYEGDEAIYEASAIDVDVVSGQIALAEIQYLVDTGVLDVEVLGLPDGVDHDIEVIDSDGNAMSLPQSGQLAALEAGTYDVVPGDVEEGLATYEAEAQEVTIEVDETTNITVEYEATDGELPVEITGLNGVDADVTLEGDSGDITVTETTTLTLEPGTYDVVATDVTANGTTYAVSSAPTTVDVSSGDNDALEIDYELVLGDLQVVVDGLNGVDGDVMVSGPDGFEETITETTSFSELVPGEYTATAETVTDGLREYS